MAGYSPNTLVRKLGLKDGDAALIISVPSHIDGISDYPGFSSVETQFQAGPRDRDYIHWFASSRHLLEQDLPSVSGRLKADGMLWISWPKKSSKVPTDVTENVLREVFLPLMLVDVKVCAVDEIWSGLKFMWRIEHRANLT